MPKKYLGVGQDQGATQIDNVADPTSAQDAATKAYVDDWNPRLVYKTSDTAKTNNTLAADPHLTFSVAANTKYIATYSYIATGPTTNAGIRIRHTFPANCSVYVMSSGRGINVTTAEGDAYYAAFQEDTATPTGEVQWNMAGAAVPMSGFVTLLIITGATAGNVAIEWAQILTNATACTLRKGSCVSVQKYA